MKIWFTAICIVIHIWFTAINPPHPGHETDMVKCFPTDSGPVVDKKADPKLYLKLPNVEMLNNTVANVTGVSYHILVL